MKSDPRQTPTQQLHLQRMTGIFVLILLLQSFSLITCQSDIYEVYTTYTEIEASTAEWTGWSRDLVECTMMRLSSGGHGNRSYFSYCPASNECILGGPDTQIITTVNGSTTYRSKVGNSIVFILSIRALS